MTAVFRLCPLQGEPPVPAEPEDRADAARLGQSRSAERLRRRRWLRAVAAEALGVHPQAVRIVRTDNGRPLILAPEPRFASLSSAAGWVAVAVGTGPVGVDVETLPPRSPPPLDLSPSGEGAWVEAQPPAERDAAALALWTAREALAKALEIDLDTVLSAWRASVQGQSVVLRDGRRTETARLTRGSGVIAAIVEVGRGD